MLRYTSQIAEAYCFRLPYLENGFMIANLVRSSLAVMKISETFQEHTPIVVLS